MNRFVHNRASISTLKFLELIKKGREGIVVFLQGGGIQFRCHGCVYNDGKATRESGQNVCFILTIL